MRFRRHLGVEGERVGLQAQVPVGAVHLELVPSRSAAAATTPSQIPEGPAGSSGSMRPSQRFQSPTTETPRAFGAQTAKRDAVLDDVRAEALVDPLVATLPGEVEVELAELRELRLQHAEDRRRRG